jgi:glucosamine-6-phosphate deaminase
MATLLRARRIVLLATGRNKSTAVRRLVEERITPLLPASLLQLHPAVEVWVDAEAAAKLTARGL